jgi:hypothetical protein
MRLKELEISIFFKRDLNIGAFMNIFRFALPLALTLALSINVFADDELAPRGGTGFITIITDPPNSDIYLDGVDLGKSPIKKKSFHSGPLRLIVMDQGKELINTRFNVWPGKDNVYQGATVMPAGTILVNTTPNKCHIYMDDEIADRTDGGPLTLNSVDAGDHMLGAACPGKKRYDVLINVKGEQTTEVHLDAVKRKHTIKYGAKKETKGEEDEE